MKKKVTRRELLKALVGATGLVGLVKALGIPLMMEGLAQELDEQAYLPIITGSGGETSTDTPTPANTPTATAAPTNTPTATPVPTETPTPAATSSPPTGSEVIHVHDDKATSWDFSTGWYGDYVNQTAVNNMVDEGLRQLTGESTVETAWQALLPSYTPGEAIAVKVNFNNARCTDTDNIIDALIEPVNALIRSLKERGVQEEDIWVYDASRPVPDRFRTRCLYANVRFFDTSCAQRATFDSSSPSAVVGFDHPSLTDRLVTDVVIDAAYVINVPIIKDHSICGATLGFKNHFGTINRIARAGDDNLHHYIKPGHSNYDPGYNPLLDIYANPNIRDKTVLIVGDGLYGALGNTNVTPSRWASFGDDAANSLFFATDPVAMDCVLLDILDADPHYHPRHSSGHTDAYLELAANAGLGVFERGDPWGSGYEQINYVRVEL